MPEKANRPNAPSGSDSTTASRGQLSICFSVDAIAAGSWPSIASASVSTWLALALGAVLGDELARQRRLLPRHIALLVEAYACGRGR